MIQPDHDGVCHQNAMPLGWCLARSVTPDTLERWMHTNTTLLRALAVFEAQPSEREREPNPATGKALDRMEAKIDLALSLMTQLLAQHTRLPETRPVVLWADSIEWIEREPPAAGDEVAISVWLDPRLPQPLILPATVTAASPGPDGASVHARLLHLNPETRDWLERTLFRYHRRAIQHTQSRSADMAG